MLGLLYEMFAVVRSGATGQIESRGRIGAFFEMLMLLGTLADRRFTSSLHCSSVPSEP